MAQLRCRFSLEIPRQPDIETEIIAKRPRKILKRRVTVSTVTATPAITTPKSILKRGQRGASTSPKRVSFFTQNETTNRAHGNNLPEFDNNVNVVPLANPCLLMASNTTTNGNVPSHGSNMNQSVTTATVSGTGPWYTNDHGYECE